MPQVLWLVYVVILFVHPLFGRNRATRGFCGMVCLLNKFGTVLRGRKPGVSLGRPKILDAELLFLWGLTKKIPGRGQVCCCSVLLSMVLYCPAL